MIYLAYTHPELLKPGVKVQVLTDEDHKSLGNRSQTSSWGPQAERKYCYKDLVLTSFIINCLKEKQSIPMREFSEFRGESWIMHYADFKIKIKKELIEVPVYQCLSINTETHEVSNIVISKSEKQALEFQKIKEQTNTNKNIIYQIITLKLPEIKEVPEI